MASMGLAQHSPSKSLLNISSQHSHSCCHPHLVGPGHLTIRAKGFRKGQRVFLIQEIREAKLVTEHPLSGSVPILGDGGILRLDGYWPTSAGNILPPGLRGAP